MEELKNCSSTLKVCGPLGLNVDYMAEGFPDAWCPLLSTAEHRDPIVAWRDYLHRFRRLGVLWARIGCHLEDVTIGVALQRSVVAGVDGRSPHEVRMLVRIGPWLAQELYDVWREATSVGVATPTEACEKLRSVRTVGTPKGDGNEAQPISVAYVWARAWHNALLWCFLVALDLTISGIVVPVSPWYFVLRIGWRTQRCSIRARPCQCIGHVGSSDSAGCR